MVYIVPALVPMFFTDARFEDNENTSTAEAKFLSELQRRLKSSTRANRLISAKAHGTLDETKNHRIF